MARVWGGEAVEKLKVLLKGEGLTFESCLKSTVFLIAL